MCCWTAVGDEPQPPVGESGLSFRSDVFFAVADDFTRTAEDPIVAVRWWGSYAEEAEPHDTGSPVPFTIEIYDSQGGLPDALLASYAVDAVETYTGVMCPGTEGLGGGDACPGLEPLYMYEACLDPPFVPQPETAYFLAISSDILDEAHFWAWHEGEVSHPQHNEAATNSCIFGCSWDPGVINACPGDFSFLVGPYDTAFELLLECPQAPDCPADLDGDGQVGPFDLALLLGNWGPCAGCPADLDSDGQVGPFDLALLLGSWGPCG